MLVRYYDFYVKCPLRCFIRRHYEQLFPLPHYGGICGPNNKVHDRDVTGEKDCTESCAGRALCGVDCRAEGPQIVRRYFGSLKRNWTEMKR